MAATSCTDPYALLSFSQFSSRLTHTAVRVLRRQRPGSVVIDGPHMAGDLARLCFPGWSRPTVAGGMTPTLQRQAPIVLGSSAVPGDLLAMPVLTNYDPDHPLVLLTDFPPHAGGGGAVILRSLMDQATRRSIVWMTLTPGGDRGTSPSAGERVVVLTGGARATPPRAHRSISETP